MKKIDVKLVTLLYLLTLTCYAGEIGNPPEKKSAAFSWTEKEYDFGTIKKDKSASYTFNFQNSGDLPLVIVSVYGSCGCTVSSYTKGEIPSGQSGNVSTTYDASTLGVFHKTITIKANTGEGPVTLHIKGEVVQ